jgi:TatD DNase family protein
MLLVDSHCHLNYPEFAHDCDLVVDRAREQGVGVLQTICTRMSEFPEVLRIAETYPQVYASVGIHPHEVEKESVTLQALVEAAAHPKVIGLGETGLDYYYEHSPRGIQAESFRTHIRAAQTTGLPLIIHTRDAEEDTIRILREERENGDFTGVIHCFTGTESLARAVLEMGLSISISGVVTFKKADELRAVVRDVVPLSRILVETDAPFLAPLPHRGERNEPAYTRLTAEKVAELKTVSLAEAARQTTDNFFALFTKAQRPVG